MRLLTLCPRRGKNYVVCWTRSPLQPHSTTRQPQLDMGLAWVVPLGCTPKVRGDIALGSISAAKVRHRQSQAARANHWHGRDELEL